MLIFARRALRFSPASCLGEQKEKLGFPVGLGRDVRRVKNCKTEVVNQRRDFGVYARL